MEEKLQRESSAKSIDVQLTLKRLKEESSHKINLEKNKVSEVSSNLETVKNELRAAKDKIRSVSVIDIYC